MSDRDSGLDSGEESNDTMFMNDETNDSSLENDRDAGGRDDDDEDEDLNNYIVFNVNNQQNNSMNAQVLANNQNQMINNHYNDIIEIDPSPSPVGLSQISQMSSSSINMSQASTSFDNLHFASSSSSSSGILMRASSSSVFPNQNHRLNPSLTIHDSLHPSTSPRSNWSPSSGSSSFPVLSTSHLTSQNSNHQSDSCNLIASTSSSCSSSSSSIIPPAPSSSPVFHGSSSSNSHNSVPSASSSQQQQPQQSQQNVNVFGVDFSIDSADLSNLWNFYVDNSDWEQQQHDFCPKMSKQRQRRKFVQFEQYSRNLIGEKQLRMAANNNDYEAVCRLLKAGVDTKACDERKRTALHFAACHGFIDIAYALLDHGADPNQQDIVGNTPLHLAVCASKLDIVILLLKNGANCNASDNSGRTPLQLAKSKLTILSKSLGKSKSLLPEFKLETLKISMMLGIYFEKTISSIGNSEKNDDRQLMIVNQQQQQKAEIERFQDRITTGETAEELENDVNDLLRCIDKWTLS